MDWTFPSQASGDDGLRTMAERLIRETGDDRLPGTRFTYDAREMLAATREIEASVASGGRLWVGFQRAAKLEHEVPRYERITGAGTGVVAFGTGTPRLPASVDLRWIEVEPSSERVENQWFLVTTQPEPIAFVSWEVSDPARFGEGGITEAGKQFVGFVTDDRRVIEALLDHLRTIAGAEVAT
jgi:hypothetical protein